MGRPLVFLCCPHNGSVAGSTLRSLCNAGKSFELVDGCLQEIESPSLLAFGFNHLWCAALNSNPRPTHFAMLHADLAPEPRWLDTLLQKMRETGADVMTTINAIKDRHGLTSTGIHDPKTGRMRKFTTREVELLPETFTADSAGFPGQCLLMNTGCWVADFTTPWVAEMPGFQMRDRIAKDKTGKFIPQCLSEDWWFSVWAHRRGLKVGATKAVKTLHKGSYDYPNCVGWGAWETDQESGTLFGMNEDLDPKA
jgi:hypothetical protein